MGRRESFQTPVEHPFQPPACPVLHLGDSITPCQSFLSVKQGSSSLHPLRLWSIRAAATSWLSAELEKRRDFFSRRYIDVHASAHDNLPHGFYSLAVFFFKIAKTGQGVSGFQPQGTPCKASEADCDGSARNAYDDVTSHQASARAWYGLFFSLVSN